MRDVVIVGGGPAGLACAIALARGGREVEIFEPTEGVIDKACGEGLMPASVCALEQLGVHPQGEPFSAIRYRAGQALVEAPLPSPGLGVRRTTLHRALLDQALQVGVALRRERVEHLEPHGDHVLVNGQKASWLVGADGLRSTVRHQLGLDAPSPWPARIGLRKHFVIAPETSAVDVWWADGLEAYVTPVGPQEVCVALLLYREARGEGPDPFTRNLHKIPELAQMLEGAAASSHVRGAGPFATASRKRVLGRALLLGDAAGYLDPITGEGLKLGLLGALDVAQAILTQNPRLYEDRWRVRYRRYAQTTGALLLATRPRPLRRALLPILGAAPWLMRAVVRKVAD